MQLAASLFALFSLLLSVLVVSDLFGCLARLLGGSDGTQLPSDVGEELAVWAIVALDVLASEVDLEAEVRLGTSGNWRPQVDRVAVLELLEGLQEQEVLAMLDGLRLVVYLFRLPLLALHLQSLERHRLLLLWLASRPVKDEMLQFLFGRA